MICPKCGTENGDSSLKCVKCWRPLQPQEKWFLAGAQTIPDSETAAEKTSLRQRGRIFRLLVVLGMLLLFIAPIFIDQLQILRNMQKQGTVHPVSDRKQQEMNPADKKRNHPGNQEVFIPSLEAYVRDIRFFESGCHPADTRNRVYATDFRKDRTCYIHWELRLAYPKRHPSRAFQIEEIWYQPDGSVLARQHFTGSIQESWNHSFHYHGWGWNEPAHWNAGKYRVELFIDGSLIAVGSFTIS
jgi:hypothetical protein